MQVFCGNILFLSSGPWFDCVGKQVFCAEMDLGNNLLSLLISDNREFRLDQTLEIRKRLLRMNEKDEGLDIFSIRVLVLCAQRDDEFEELGGSCQKLAYEALY